MGDRRDDVGEDSVRGSSESLEKVRKINPPEEGGQAVTFSEDMKYFSIRVRKDEPVHRCFMVTRKHKTMEQVK